MIVSVKTNVSHLDLSLLSASRNKVTVLVELLSDFSILASGFARPAATMNIEDFINLWFPIFVEFRVGPLIVSIN